jgi:hypothetical protein
MMTGEVRGRAKSAIEAINRKQIWYFMTASERS